MTDSSPDSDDAGITPRTSRHERRALFDGPPDDGVDVERVAEEVAEHIRPPADIRSTRIVLMPYNPDWRKRFLSMGQRLRRELGDTAVRVDHIGSTAIPGMTAKPVIDLQVSVPSLVDVDAAGRLAALEPLGLELRTDDSDATRRYLSGDFRGLGLSTVQVREHGSFGQQVHLLFRDFLRTVRTAAGRFAEEKERLAGNTWITLDEYDEAKDELIWALLHEASRWAAEVGWRSGASDA